MRTAVALGSNLGDRLVALRAARQAIVDLPGVRSPILSSAVYETDAVGCEPGARKFFNAVIEFEYDGKALDLLKSLQKIEHALGRPPDHARYVSRKIDIDILYSGDTKIDNKQLQLPHPRMHERKFVLQPLADIRPDLVLPGQTTSICELLTQLRSSGQIVQSNKGW